MWVKPNLFSIPFDINGENISASFQIKMSDMQYYTYLRIHCDTPDPLLINLS